MTNKEALEHLWKSVDKSSIYQLSYIRNLAFELGEKELYFVFNEVPTSGYQLWAKAERIVTIPHRD